MCILKMKRTPLVLLLFCSFLDFSYSAKDLRIIGGTPARPSDFPFVAAFYKTTDDGQYFCGGTIVNERWILTAAQCVYNAIFFDVQLGSVNLTNQDPDVANFTTEAYVIHPDFNPVTLENDIGLIKLQMDIIYTTKVKPVDLGSTYLHPSDVTGILCAMGWGATSDTTPFISNELNYVYMDLLENEDCKVTYGNQITDNMMCAIGLSNATRGTCLGDTGSPLMHRYLTREQIGIASFVSGNGCENSDPSGFTRVSPYIDWIQNVTSLE